MNLELKHLAPYLPYDLEYAQKKESYTTEEFYFVKKGVISTKGVVGNVNSILDTNFYFPILKPISDFSLLVIEEFEKYDGKRNGKANEEIINLFCEENGVDEIIENIVLSSLPYECIDFIFKNHYDFFGLISQGLAVSIHDVVQAEA